MTQHLECPFEVKLAAPEEGAAETMTFSGYGAVFDNIDSYGDMLVKGAFAETLGRAKTSGQWPAMLLQHGGVGFNAEDMTPIGIWTEMREDDIGLYVEGKLADTARGREAHALLTMQPRPALNGLSIGYITKSFEPRSRPEEPRRKLTKVDLVEVSLVTFPANPKARVAQVKAEIDEISELKDAERFLREAANFSRSESVAFVSRIKAIAQREAGAEGELAALIRRAAAIINPK